MQRFIGLAIMLGEAYRRVRLALGFLTAKRMEALADGGVRVFPDIVQCMPATC
jgi:hypothetical protein